MTSQVTSWETALCFSAHHTDKTHTPPRRKPRRPNKKGTNQKPKEKTRNTHKRNLDNKHAAGCTAVISCCLCRCAMMSLQLSLVCPNVSRPQVEFRHRRGDAISNELDRPPSWNESWLGGRLRASVSPIGNVSAAQIGSLGHAKERAKFAKGRLSERLCEKICYIHICWNVANSE